MSNEIALMREIARLEEKINALRTIEIGGVWQNWTPTSTGWSSNPTGYYRYCLVGKLCTLMIRQNSAGTSNSTSTIITAPFASVSMACYYLTPIQFRDSGSTKDFPGMAQIGNGSNNINFYTNWSGGGWTASGDKRILNCVLAYEIA